LFSVFYFALIPKVALDNQSYLVIFVYRCRQLIIYNYCLEFRFLFCFDPVLEGGSGFLLFLVFYFVFLESTLSNFIVFIFGHYQMGAASADISRFGEYASDRELNSRGSSHDSHHPFLPHQSFPPPAAPDSCI